MLLSVVLLLGGLTAESYGLVSYGPSMRDLITPELSVQGRQTDWNTISLAEYAPSYTVVVPLLNGAISANKTQVLKLFPNFHHGTFFVEAPEGYSIVAIVQVLRLPQVTGKPGTCLDFIEFKDMTNMGKISSPICGVVEAQELSIEPSGLIGPRAFTVSGGKLAVKLFIFSNTITQESDIDPARGAITVEISFTASLNTNPLNVVGILFTAHMGLCQFLNYDGGQNDTWVYCPSPGVPDCIHESLFCDKEIQCASDTTAAEYGVDQVQCGQEALYTNLTENLRTLWRLSELEVKTERTPLRIEATRLVIIVIGAILVGIFVAVFTWRLIVHIHCCKACKRGSKSSSDNTNNNEAKSVTYKEEEECDMEAAAERRRHQQRLQSAVFIAKELLAAQEEHKRRMTIAFTGSNPLSKTAKE